MTERLDPRLAQALRAWRDGARCLPDSPARLAARHAMMEAVREQRRALAGKHGPWRMRVARALAAVWTRPRLALVGLAPPAVCALSIVGWSSPAGSPLHFVEVSRESAQLAVPGADRVGLELTFAESRLQDARLGKAPSASLQEAQRLLAAAHRDLPGNPPTQTRSRLYADVNRLIVQRAILATPALGGGSPSTPCPASLCLTPGLAPAGAAMPSPTVPVASATPAPVPTLGPTPLATLPPTVPPTLPPPVPTLPPPPAPTLPPAPVPTLPAPSALPPTPTGVTPTLAG